MGEEPDNIETDIVLENPDIFNTRVILITKVLDRTRSSAQSPTLISRLKKRPIYKILGY